MRLSLKLKVTLLVLGGLILGVVYGIVYLRHNIQRASAAEKIVTQGALFSAISEVVHEIQIERGKTTGFLSKNISEQELLTHRLVVDEKVAALQALLKAEDPEKTFSLPQDLREIREMVSSGAETSKIVSTFRDSIMALIEAQVLISKNATLDGLEMQLLGINMLELAKEYAGRARATLSPIFGAKKPLTVQQVVFLEDLRSRIYSHLQTPVLELSSEGKQRVADFLGDLVWKKVELGFEDAFTEALSGNFKNEPQQFFRDATQSIDALREIVKAELSSVSIKSGKIRADSSRDMWTTLVLLSCSLLIVAALSLWIIRGITVPIDQAVSGLNSASESIAMSSSQVTEASQQVSAGAVESASALEEIVASIEELSSIVKQNAERASVAAKLSTEGCDSAEAGRSEMLMLIGAMADISKSSRRIEEIINVIDDIAFQTNLLALNASVEAARAGDQGKGFAVVAEAVRALAQRSASAAKDIGELIKESVEQVDNGSKVAESSEGALSSIMEVIRKIAVLNNEIAVASSEQSSGIQQISKAMNELDLSTQSNASVAEEVSASANQMNGQVEGIGNLVSKLRGIVDGAA